MIRLALPLLLAAAQQAMALPPGTPVVAREAQLRSFTLDGAPSAPVATPDPAGVSPELGGLPAPQNFPPGDVGALTGFFGFNDCSDDQKRALTDAFPDSLALAGAAITRRDELFIQRSQINWNSEPAVAYFSAPDKNKDYRNKIVEVFENAAMAKSRWGDWWNNRYVELRCDADANTCGQTSAAYTSLRQQPYTKIYFCPNYFSKLKPHRELWDKMVNDKDLQNNVANLRSQATTMLHEWLHIDDPKTQVCRDCRDVVVFIGPRGEMIRVYKPGRAKLLASQVPQSASENNDSFAYFAMTQLMYKKFGKMPECPLKWDPTLSIADNRAREERTCPVKAMDADAYALEESDPDVPTSTTITMVPTSTPQ